MKIKAVSEIMVALLIFSMLGINMIGIALAQETHDIAVISVTPYPTMVGLGEPVNVTVIIENQGTKNETFSVTTYCNNTIIETQNVTDQTPNTNTTLTFTWNTTGITAGTYSINATASIVTNETDTADNTLVSPSTVDVVSPYIAVLPRSTVDLTLTPGQSYTVSIHTNYNGSDIWGYEFDLTYNPLVLYGVEVVNGDLITDGDALIFSAGEFNNTEGTLSLTGAIALNMTPTPPVLLNSTGPGILANVTFTIVGLGESPITLESKTKLKRVDGTNIIDYLDDQDPNPTRGKFLHGHFQNVPEVTHDVAVTSVDPYPTSVKQGEPVTINVAIRNNGTVVDGVTVKVYYGFDPIIGPFNLIEEETVTLESGVNETLTFTWNTTAASVGTHPITAVAELIFGFTDVNPDDNMLKIDDAVEVTAQILIEYVSPQSGPIGTTVYISGSGATPNGEVRAYFGETNVANTTADYWGWWSASFRVPDVDCGNYTITALDVTTKTTKSAIFTVTPPPTIQVYPSEAPIGSKITISGEGFRPNQRRFITFEDLLLFPFVMTDENGEFNVTLFVPMVNSGNYTIKAIRTYLYQVAIANVSFTVTLGVDDLQATYNSLLTNYTNLQGDYDSLRSDYNTYEADYNSLESSYNSLNSTYNDLKSKYDALTADLESTKNLSYLLIITTIVFIATTVLFAIRKPRAKPESKDT